MPASGAIGKERSIRQQGSRREEEAGMEGGIGARAGIDGGLT